MDAGPIGDILEDTLWKRIRTLKNQPYFLAYCNDIGGPKIDILT
jgi:hypothetical protein